MQKYSLYYNIEKKIQQDANLNKTRERKITKKMREEKDDGVGNRMKGMGYLY